MNLTRVGIDVLRVEPGGLGHVDDVLLFVSAFHVVELEGRGFLGDEVGKDFESFVVRIALGFVEEGFSIFLLFEIDVAKIPAFTFHVQ